MESDGDMEEVTADPEPDTRRGRQEGKNKKGRKDKGEGKKGKGMGKDKGKKGGSKHAKGSAKGGKEPGNKRRRRDAEVPQNSRGRSSRIFLDNDDEEWGPGGGDDNEPGGAESSGNRGAESSGARPSKPKARPPMKGMGILVLPPKTRNS